MTAYVDDAAIIWRGKARFHLIADTIDELHAFAARIDVKRCWFHRGASYLHNDITTEQREAAIAAGAVQVSDRELVRIARAAV